MLIRKKLPEKLPALSGIREITQLSIITRDTEKTVQQLVKALNPGSFKLLSAKPPELFNTSYQGAKENWAMKAGLTWIGNTQVEVIQPIAGMTVFDDYLVHRDDRAGIEHIYFDAENFETTCNLYRKAGYPLQQDAQLNAAGKLGILPIPALPKFLRHLAARFGYTSTQDALKVDIELAKFPQGITQRTTLRAAIPEKWVPASRPFHFEDMPAQCPLKDIDAFYILCNDLEVVTWAYSKLTDKKPVIEKYDEDHLPGTGRLAYIRAGTSLLVLVQPEEGAVHTWLSEQGEGLSLLRGRPQRDIKSTKALLQDLGWVCSESKSAIGEVRLFATHQSLPFGLWISSD
ncbi:MAG: hypothetical protein AAF632_22155 [Bacteroidota bacterium]